MKKGLLNLCMMAAICVVIGCASSAFGQMRVGGFKTVSSEDAGVQAATEFVLQEKSKELGVELSLETIHKAEVQVVQGKNYRLCLQIYAPSKEAETDGVTLFIQTIIYNDLKNKYKITKWEDSECDQAQ